MQILEDAPQGSQAWHAARATHFCASEASAAMSVSKYMTRNALLQLKKTGISEEITPAKQRLFDAGHASEKAAREIAAEIAGVVLYPSVGTAEIEGLPLLASFDGIDMMEDVVWENKLRNTALVAQVANRDLHPHYWAQLEHQLLVSGASKALFTTSDGTKEGTESMWYESVPERRAQVIAAWKQFAADLADFVPAEPVAEVVGRTPETLPALRIEVTGEVTASNLVQYREHALAVFAGINRDLKTDQDFANAAKTVSWCGEVESRLKAAKEHALSQTESIDALFKTIDAITDEAKATRLELGKLVEARKIARKGEIVAGGVKALADHIAALNARIGRPYMPAAPADFGGAIKGLRTFDSMQNAVDTALANAKIAASAAADRIEANLKHLAAEAGEYGALFPDVATVVQKQPDDFAALVQFRVADHKAKEQKRADALAEQAREKIREEERRRAEQEQQAEQQRVAREQAATTAPAAVAPPTVAAPAASPAPAVIQMPVRAAAPAGTPPTLSLGQISTRLGFQVTAAFLASLGFSPAGRERASVLFHEADFGRICAALVSHIESIQAKQAA